MAPPLFFASLWINWNQAWANAEKFSGNPENTDNYLWEIYVFI